MKLAELRERLEAKRDEIRGIFEQAKGKDTDGAPIYDFQPVTHMDVADDLKGAAKSKRVSEVVGSLTAEVNDLAEQIETIEAAEKSLDQFEEGEQTVKRPTMPGEAKGERKTLGQMLTAHPTFKQWAQGSREGRIEIKNYGLSELKTLFETSAGWAPESTRTGYVVDEVSRPIQVLDIMPSGQTGQASVVYMEETTRTHAAAETAEGTAKPEDAFALTEASTPVREIASSIPVTEIQLEDVPMVESYLEGRMNFGIRQRLDQQVISGDGIAPNLEGILNVTGIQTYALTAEPMPDAIHKAMTLVRITGRSQPTHVVLHPNDWQEIRLLRTADGIYIWGSPSESGTPRMWGLPVIESESLTEDTGLVGSFQTPWITLFERRGILIEQGVVNTQFKDNQRTIRASGRYALAVYRPAAFCTVTSLD